MPAACRTRPLLPFGALVAATAASALTGCSSSGGGSSGSGTVQVDASDTACQVSVNTLPAGPVSIAVSNTGSKVTEVYVYAPGDRIVTERENIGPGTRATVTAELRPGSYEIACKPGMTGDGIRQKITVVPASAAASASASASASAPSVPASPASPAST
ncbi:cupredoxin domain-containing protein [Kitasatospora sp. NBC_00240]|uniref:cupredoxin domain-containing protein n=1 Tax=Kitasatospora sp. NBC_00240 TaxID=2903567 RepID=UPI002B1DA698|nr:cupredoxin domain-containing protein [Kitasatospora sp. NBC_00240]